ncbi:Sec-independent protein translocase subunit TatA [Sphaerisporangium sp. NPDC051017]|uniref:Sec-independent protein translocase subunit TatA n=1 Tax=Sphaerisporangium sp. NPDC051017 TaxID=3154636 RepID=UPI0034141590
MLLRNGLEPWHLMIVALAAILLFGSKKLPDAARALGQSLRILKHETAAMRDDDADGRSSEPRARQGAASGAITAGDNGVARPDGTAG